MTTSALLREINGLNKDIDHCRGKLEPKLVRSSCPPNCYCDKRVPIEQKTDVTATRTKTSTATVTKTDLSPRRSQNKSGPTRGAQAKVKKPTRPRTASDIYDEDVIHYHGNDRNNVQTTRYESDFTEPVKLTNKCQHVKKEPSWAAILQQNAIKDQETCSPNYRNQRSNRGSSSSSSSVSSAAWETPPVYMKNKGIQCGEKLSQDEGKFSRRHHPLNHIQYLIMHMKSKLKDDPDPSIGSMLTEMEINLQKIPFDRGDCYAMNDVCIRKRKINFKLEQVKLRQLLARLMVARKIMIQPDMKRKAYLNAPKDVFTAVGGPFLNPRPDFLQVEKSRERLEATYQELESTCSKLKVERDNAVQKASQKSIELIESMRREAETKAKLSETNLKIHEMSTKLETYTKSMEGLTEHVKRLQTENKDLERIRGQVSQLSVMMRELTQENKTLLTELQLVTIERNKLEVELAIKEQELDNRAKELQNVSELLLENTKTFVKEGAKKHTNRRDSGKPAHRSSTPHQSPQLVASSPNTSSSDSLVKAGFNNSWIAFSTIDADAEEDDPADEKEPTLVNRREKYVKETKNPVIVRSKSKRQHLLVQNPCQNTKNSVGQTTPNRQEKRPNISKIEHLKEEIRRMFTEMRELAQDVPSIPIIEYSTVEDSSELNWSEMSNTNNSYDSISDLQSSEFNEFLDKNKFKLQS